MRVAWIAPARSPATRAGRAVRELLPHLRAHAEVELYVPSGAEGEEADGTRSRSLSELRPKAHDALVLSVSNEPEAAFVLPIVRALGGTVWMHDWALPDLAAAAFPTIRRRGPRGAWLALREGGFAGLRERRFELRGTSDGTQALPIWNRSIVRWADAFLVHSELTARRIRVERNALTPIAVLPLGCERRWASDDRLAARAALRVEGAGDEEWIASATPLDAPGSAELFADVVLCLRAQGREPRILVAGASEAAFARVARAANGRASKLGRDRGLDALRAADAAIHVGGPATGEGLEGLAAALSLGRAIVAQEQPELDEIPLGALPRARTAEALARLVAELSSDASRRAALEHEARRYVDDVAHWSGFAPRCIEALSRFPAARGMRRPLVVAMLRAREEARRRG